MGKINTVLFDFDGTVMDTNDVIIQSWQQTFRAMENREEDVDTIIKTMGEPLVYTMANFFPGVPVEKPLNIYRDFQKENFIDLITLFPGMKELLENLKSAGYKLALVTSRLKLTTEQGVAKFGLGKYFDYILTADDTDRHKPDPAPILITLEKLGSVPEESIMVGDTVFDLECAHNAGVRAVIVDWTIAMTDEEKKRADYVIKTAGELLEIL